MGYLEGIDRHQVMLLPAAVDDYVTAGNPVRAIDAFVEGLKLKELKIEERQAGEVGAPGYHPRTMLKLYLYGYLNRIRSSRELEKAACRNLEVIWLMRQLTPDHWTINAFRRVHRKTFREVFREFNLVCGSLGLFGAELVAIDGTHLKAVNSPARNFTKAKVQEALREIDEKSEAYLRALDSADQEAARQSVSAGQEAGGELRQKLAGLEEERKRCQELVKDLEQSETGQISLTDPDSRMLKKGAQSVVGYNAQAAVDTKHHLIVAEEVTQEPSDWKLLEPMAVAAKESLEVETLRVVADTGYSSREQVRHCVAQGIEPNIPPKQPPANRQGLYPVEAFRYEPEKDAYLCPNGRLLTRHSDSVRERVTYQMYYSTVACRGCPLLAQCTNSKYRKLAIAVNDEAMQAMAERARTQPELQRQRSQTVEHVFGTIKFWWGFRSFLCRGLAAVQAEFSMTALAYNFRRVLNVLGAEGLLEALRARRAA
jgi:transposase